MSIINQLSPGIAVNEIDLTTIVPSVATSVGAYVGQFSWGPCDEPKLISDENQLVSVFGKPSTYSGTSFAASSFFCCANFLSYTNALYVVRTIQANTANNASANVNANFVCKNDSEYDFVYFYANTGNAFGPFAARYPGSVGNSLKVSVCASNEDFTNWEYKNYFDNAPGTSQYAIDKTGNYSANDELHIVVVDKAGSFTGKANTILEKYSFLSKSSDATDINGRSAYYKEYLRQNSQYIFSMDPIDYSNTSSTWGLTVGDLSVGSGFYSPANYSVDLSGGSEGLVPTDGELELNWDKFKDKDSFEISLAFVGSSSVGVAQHVLDQIVLGAESESPTTGRRDTMLFVSPRFNDVVNKPNQEVERIVTDNDSFLNMLARSSSYMVADSGWKYQYDRYNNVYRWIPLNADIAGLCAYTDSVADPWYSPGGFNRGRIKNVVKLAWSPNLTERDALYKNGVNPVIFMKGEGVVLLGDKTMQAKPSAFDRINVRRLFITLEKAISRSARYSLFEFNDAFTRAQFVAMIEPYLRTVKGRRGIIDFKVICDETNNTPDIIDRNAFVGDIYIKPARSINYIQLNFVAVRTGVEFSTVIGQF